MAPRTVLRPAGLVALLLGLAAIVTYPQVRQIDTAVNDFGDPLLNAWALAWTAHILPGTPSALFDANIFYPERGTLALSETLVFPALLVAPVRWLGFNPIALHNITLLLGYALSGLTMFVLVRHVTGQPWAALVAAVIFTTTPLRTDHFPRVQLQQTYLMPVALLQLHRIAGGARGWKPAFLLGLTVAAQFASCVYHAVYFVTVLPVLTLFLVLLSRQAGRRALAQLTIAVLVAGAVIAIFVPAYLRNRSVVGERVPGELVAGSAELRDYRRAHPQNLLYGSRDSIGPAERRLFPGFTTLGLAAAGLAAPVALAGPYVVALAVAVDSSLGVNGHLYPGFYAYLLPYRGLRVPARYAMLASMFLSVLAGLGVASLLKRVGSRAARHAVVAMATGLVIAESLNRPFVLRTMPPAVPTVYEWLRTAPPGVVVEYPIAGLEGRIGPQDPTYMYYSTTHWKPLLNGYSGFAPPSYFELLERMHAFPSAASIEYLRAREARYLLVHSAYYINGGFEQDIEALQRLPGLRRVAQFRSAAHGETDVYELAR
jgi:hypothetical protein